MCLKPETTLCSGTYTIKETISQNRFGITYLAVQNMLNREVYINEFFMIGFSEREGNAVREWDNPDKVDIMAHYHEYFMNEVHKLAKLNHKGIARLIDAFNENNTDYYVMERIEGQTLEERISNKGALTYAVAKRYALQIADALRYMHQNGTTYYNVDPKSIVINEKDEAVVADFNIYTVRELANEVIDDICPDWNRFAFWSPEIIEGNQKNFSPQIDIYSLGCVLYYMLSGQNPPSYDDRLEMFENWFPVDTFKARGVSDATIETIKKAISIPRKRRQASMDEFINMLGNKAQTNNTTTKTAQSKTEDEDVTVLRVKPSRSKEPPTKPLQTYPNKKYALMALVGCVVYAIVARMLFGQIGDIDFDGIKLMGLFVVSTLIIIGAIFKQEKQNDSKYKNCRTLFAALSIANSTLLGMWNYSLLDAYFVLSICLAVLASLSFYRKI